MEQSQNSLARLNSVVEELIGIVRKQQADFKQALAVEKEKAESAVAENTRLNAELERVTARVAELENASASNNGELDEIKARLEEAVAAKDEYAQKYAASEQKLTEMQQTISQTTENIDGVVARLEKVLEENGAGNNND